MQKTAYFDTHWGDGWPPPDQVDACLLDPSGRRRFFFEKRRDGGCFKVEGLNGTNHLIPAQADMAATLHMYANPTHGMALFYSEWDGKARTKTNYCSVGDRNRLFNFVNSLHGTPISIGLFISFDAGCRAIREFLESDGEMPSGDFWVNERDMPPEAFPDPGAASASS